MYETLAVRVRERVRNFSHVLNCFANWQRSVLQQPLLQRSAIHERHHIVRQSIGFAGIEQRQNIRMLQGRRDEYFAREPFASQGHGQFGTQHLDRHVGCVPLIARTINRGHSSTSDFTGDLVAVRQRGENGNPWVGHSCSKRDSGRNSGAALRVEIETVSPSNMPSRLLWHNAAPSFSMRNARTRFYYRVRQ